MMIICEQVLTAVSEFNGEYQGKTASEVIDEHDEKKKSFCLYVLLESNGLEALLYNIYSIDDEGMQGEYAIYSIVDKVVYHSADNHYPRSGLLETVSEIFTREQFIQLGVTFRDGVPEVRSTGYHEWIDNN